MKVWHSVNISRYQFRVSATTKIRCRRARNWDGLCGINGAGDRLCNFIISRLKTLSLLPGASQIPCPHNLDSRRCRNHSHAKHRNAVYPGGKMEQGVAPGTWLAAAVSVLLLLRFLLLGIGYALKEKEVSIQVCQQEIGKVVL